MRDIFATTDFATRSRSDGACKNTVLVGFEVRVLSIMVGPIASLTDAIGQTFTWPDENAAAYYDVAGGTVKGDENWSPVFVKFRKCHSGSISARSQEGTSHVKLTLRNTRSFPEGQLVQGRPVLN